jgi:hypothetical protein
MVVFRKGGNGMKVKGAMVVVMSFFTLLTLGLGQDTKKDSNQQGLIVHEWGVIQLDLGSKGALLRANPSEEDLPKFVEMPKPPKQERWEPPRPMKPIIYFYAQEALKSVQAGVKIDESFTAWFPKCSKATDKSLSWSFSISPQKPRNCEIKKVDKDSWWAIARDTDSAFVRTGNTVEKFLFYEGLCDFEPALGIKIGKDNKITLTNQSDKAIRHIFIISVKDKDPRVDYIKELDAKKENSCDLPERKTAEPLKELEKALVEAGLYEKEASGMVRVWEKDFFKTDGLRVLYILSQEDYDKLLPVEINPKPKEIRRVMVVQIECPPPGLAKEIDELIQKLADGKFEVREKATERLIEIGRPAIPKLKDALNHKDSEVRWRAEVILKRIDDSKFIKPGFCDDGGLCQAYGKAYFECKCVRCGGEIRISGSSAPKLCKKCADELGVCQWCQKKIKK